MHRVDHNINKDMSDFDLIDVESLDLSDEQTWLYRVPEDSGQKVDIVDWSLSLDWPVYSDEDYQKTERHLYSILDDILKKQVLAMPDKHKFDSRTFVKPKKAALRPSIHNLVEAISSSPSANNSLDSSNKYLTYNKYHSPLGPILRLKTFSVDGNTDNSNAVKEYAMKRRSLVQDDDPQLEDVDITLASDASERLSDQTPSKPINIDLSQPAHNIHNTFNKGMLMSDRGSLNMYQSGESLMRMSPPSLVSSLMMESSGTFNPESLDGRKSISNRDSGVPTSGRESIDPMMTSMTLSILDEKDMSTSFLSQTTYPDHDSLMDSLPPSLVSSVNSSYVVSNNTPRARTDSVDSNNVFSSATFTHLEQSEKLLSARPRHQMYNSFKRDNPMRNSGSYTKAKEEGCQIDNGKVLNENIDKKETSKTSKTTNDMSETIMLHYSNNKFRNSEKENCNASFEKDDAFFKDMGMQRTIDLGRNSINVTLDKQELNEIIQARQKLSLARKALPTEPDKPLPNQVDTPKAYVPTNPSTTVIKKSMDNSSELLARKRAAFGNDCRKTEDPVREPPKRNATFKKTSPRTNSMDTTVVYVKEDQNIIDINSATLNLIDADKTLQQDEWGSQARAMVASSESTDTATFSSSSPPDSVPDTAPDAAAHPRSQVASTPLARGKDGIRSDLLNLHHNISPIYGVGPIDDKSYTLTKAASSSSEGLNTTINTGTIVKRGLKRDVLAGKTSLERKIAACPPSPPGKPQPPTVKLPSSASYSIVAPSAGHTKSGLPTSKLRQYSSHRDLRMPNANNGPGGFGYGMRAPARAMVRRGVYASNPALSPTAPAPPAPAPAPPALAPPPAPLHRTDSYTIAVDALQKENGAVKNVLANPPALVRQGTETLRRERPQSQMVQPKDLHAAPPTGVPVYMRNHLKPTTISRPYSIAGAPQLRVARPVTVPYKSATAPVFAEPRPVASALPRPSRLPAPRRPLRPPSVYSVAPAAEADHY